MQTYYDVEGTVLGRAWSSAIDQCSKAKNEEEHVAHPFNPEYAMYGPYMCAGYPRIGLYTSLPREPENKP